VAELLELIESVQAEQASVARLYGGEGRSLTSHRGIDNYNEKLVRTVEILANAMQGRRGADYVLREAMTTSDFPYLFGDVLDRQLLQDYRETPQTYRNWCRIATVSDFRTVKRFVVNGSEATLGVVRQQGEYPESKLTDAPYSYAVQKYGRRIPFSWEAIVDDDLGALRDIPQRFGRAARRTEEKFATGLLADANGPHASFFTVGNKNTVIVANGALVANPPLSIAGLQDAFTVLASQKDADGEPITIEAVELVVPPALMVIAENILHATQILAGGLGQVGGGGVAGQALFATNWMASKTRLNVDAYLPIVSTTNGNTSWYLIASPQGQRPAFEVGFLRGHETPEVFVKEPNQRLVGSGNSDAMSGDFDNDSIEWKIRHVIGGCQVDSKMAVASSGLGV